MEYGLRASGGGLKSIHFNVLILVLMEYGLRVKTILSDNLARIVLILVLMEYGLRVTQPEICAKIQRS